MAMYRRYRRKGVRPRRAARVAKRTYRKRYTRKRQMSSRVVMIRKERLMPVIVGSAAGIPDLFFNASYTSAFDLNNAGFDLSALQGQFELMKAYKFIVTMEPLLDQSSAANPQCYVRKVLDPGGVAYTTEAQYLANADCKSHTAIAGRSFRYIVYPKSNLNQSWNGVNTYKPVSPGWVQSTTAQLPSLIPPHVFIPPWTVGVTQFNVKITAIVGFKNNK